MTDNAVSPEAQIKSFQEDIGKLRASLRNIITGQEQVIEDLVTALLAGGHVLLEGLPGLGKTHLVKALAASIGTPLARIQCTPDLMPGDITGSEILLKENGGTGLRVDFRPGPIFTSMLLVDEINRATPKTQSALLEAMQERQVTCAGTCYKLPFPFWVIATQNPIELEGTFPLPEAQLDRFLFKISVDYPSAESLLKMLDLSLDEEPADHLGAILPPLRIVEMMRTTREIIVAEPVKRAAVDLVIATHAEHPKGSAIAKRHIRYGASPRGLQALIRAARVIALADGRGHAALEDIQAAASLALRHRILLNMESELDNIKVDEVLEEIIVSWRRTH